MWPINSRLPATRCWRVTAGSNLGFSIVILEPWDQRQTPEKSFNAIAATLQQRFSKNPRGRSSLPSRHRRLTDLATPVDSRWKCWTKAGQATRSYKRPRRILVAAGNGQANLTR